MLTSTILAQLFFLLLTQVISESIAEDWFHSLEVNIDLFHFKEGFSPKAKDLKLKKELWELAHVRCDRILSQSRLKPGRSRARIQ